VAFCSVGNRAAEGIEMMPLPVPPSSRKPYRSSFFIPRKSVRLMISEIAASSIVFSFQTAQLSAFVTVVALLPSFGGCPPRDEKLRHRQKKVRDCRSDYGADHLGEKNGLT